MSLSFAEKQWLALRTVIGTMAGLSWSLALVSASSAFPPVWRLIGGTQSCLVSVGLAGQGHCWLCGMSHAFRALWQGQWQAARTYNPNAPFLFGAMLLLCASVVLLWLPRSVNIRSGKQILPAGSSAGY